VECPIGQCRFIRGYGPPEKTVAGGAIVYATVFQSWSTGGPREGRLIIFFELHTGKAPLEHL
jgi:hypothetical protein